MSDEAGRQSPPPGAIIPIRVETFTTIRDSVTTAKATLLEIGGRLHQVDIETVSTAVRVGAELEKVSMILEEAWKTGCVLGRKYGAW